MKRFIAITLILCLCLCFTGCKPLDYGKASKHYKNGEYAQALELYESLRDYADSATMAHLSWQKYTYETAETAFASGDYAQAMDLYYQLERYMDSPVKAIESQYALGLALLEEGNYAESIEALRPLGTYRDSSLCVNQAFTLWLRQALEQLGDITMTLDPTGQQTLQMRNFGDSAISIVYHRESQLLGVPNTCSFTLTVYPITQTAAYEASYLSTASSTILEEASGTVDPAVFCTGKGLNTVSFTQTITQPDGTVAISEDTAHAIILHTLLAEAETVIEQNFALLLEQTGTAITPEDLGFLSLS